MTWKAMMTNATVAPGVGTEFQTTSASRHPSAMRLDSSWRRSSGFSGAMSDWNSGSIRGAWRRDRTFRIAIVSTIAEMPVECSLKRCFHLE